MLRLLLLVACCLADINVLTYDEPGEYVLTPSMYRWSHNITVDVWGSGGGGCSGTCGIGGGSGAYIRVNINTNHETFTLVVGQGGTGGIGVIDGVYNSVCYKQYPVQTWPWFIHPELYSGGDGTITSITSNVTMISMAGGRGGNYTHNYGTYSVDSIDGNIVYSTNGSPGSVGINTNLRNGCTQFDTGGCGFTVKAGDGGSTMFSGSSGKGNNGTININYMGLSYNYLSCSNQYHCPWTCTATYNYPESHGMTPGGGGGGSYNQCYKQQGSINGCNNLGGCISVYFPPAGNGGNGTIKVYFPSLIGI